jgi:hypothetical protein
MSCYFSRYKIGYRGKGKRIPGRWVAKSSNFKKDNQSDEKFKANGGASVLDRRWRKKHRGSSPNHLQISCRSPDDHESKVP